MTDIPRIALAALEPDEEVIAECEELLRLAKSGELRGLAHVGTLAKREIIYALCGRETKGSYLRTAGLLEWLKTQALLQWDHRTSESDEPRV